MAENHSIHLVPKVLPKPQLDPADIAAAVLETVRECTQALSDLCTYQEALTREMASQLNALEVVALRGIAAKVGRS